MNKITLKTFLLSLMLFLMLMMPPAVLSQDEGKPGGDIGKVENYREQIRRLMGFLEFSLNTLGGSEATTSEKEVIINDSYLKAFLNEKVQVEDDLDENREILTYKDVQAYLKDVDFFFKQAEFKIDVQDIQSLTSDRACLILK